MTTLNSREKLRKNKEDKNIVLIALITIWQQKQAPTPLQTLPISSSFAICHWVPVDRVLQSIKVQTIQNVGDNVPVVVKVWHNKNSP